MNFFLFSFLGLFAVCFSSNRLLVWFGGDESIDFLIKRAVFSGVNLR